MKDWKVKGFDKETREEKEITITAKSRKQARDQAYKLLYRPKVENVRGG